MAVIAQDSYTDVAGTSLPTHSPEAGGPWVRHPARTLGAEVITASGTSRASAAQIGLWYLTSGSSVADQYVQADFVFATIPASQSLAINARMSTTAETYYSLRYSSTSNGWFITKTVAGSQTTLTSVLTAATAGTTVRGRLEIVGTSPATLTAYLNGSQILQATDSSITAPGAFGFQRSAASQTDTTGMQLDNFEGGDFSGAAYSGTGTGTASVASTSNGQPIIAQAGAGAITVTATSSGVASFTGVGSAIISATAASSATPTARGTGAAAVTTAATDTGAPGFAQTGAAATTVAATDSARPAFTASATAQATVAATDSAVPATGGTGAATATVAATSSGTASGGAPAYSGVGTAVVSLTTAAAATPAMAGLSATTASTAATAAGSPSFIAAGVALVSMIETAAGVPLFRGVGAGLVTLNATGHDGNNRRFVVVEGHLLPKRTRASLGPEWTSTTLGDKRTRARLP